jgi:glucan 1,3-beta-glucosidase
MKPSAPSVVRPAREVSEASPLLPRSHPRRWQKQQLGARASGETGGIDAESGPVAEKLAPENDATSEKKYSTLTLATGTVVFIVLVLGIYSLFGDSLASSLQQSRPAPNGVYRGIIKSGHRYRIITAETRQYVRVDSKDNNKLVATETIPWAAGSTFEALVMSDACFKLRSLQGGRWVRSTGGIMRADSTTHLDADCLTIEGASGQFSLKVDHQRYVALTNTTLHRTGWELRSSSKAFLSSKFALVEVSAISGVNLGGWFIPEYWMMPDFYQGTYLQWNASLAAITALNPTMAEERMLNNLATWIVEDDFAQISALGFNSIRLPVGYWNVVQDPYNMYVPSNVNVSLQYIDWCFDMALKYRLSVLIDLHGAPGSQNGNDHSGVSGPVDWLKRRNSQLSLQAIDAIAVRYGSRRNLLGIELLNEPAAILESRNHTELIRYYEQAYAIVRAYSSTAWVVFNVLDEEFYSNYATSMKEPKYYNVLIDLHLYDWQAEHTRESRAQHLHHAEGWGRLIQQISTSSHPVIVGEWSMSTGKMTFDLARRH